MAVGVQMLAGRRMLACVSALQASQPQDSRQPDKPNFGTGSEEPVHTTKN